MGFNCKENLLTLTFFALLISVHAASKAYSTKTSVQQNYDMLLKHRHHFVLSLVDLTLSHTDSNDFQLMFFNLNCMNLYKVLIGDIQKDLYKELLTRLPFMSNSVLFRLPEILAWEMDLFYAFKFTFEQPDKMFNTISTIYVTIWSNYTAVAMHNNRYKEFNP